MVNGSCGSPGFRNLEEDKGCDKLSSYHMRSIHSVPMTQTILEALFHHCLSSCVKQGSTRLLFSAKSPVNPSLECLPELWHAIESLFPKMGIKSKDRLDTHPANDLET